jgi:predicted transcriptional regulator
MAGMARKQGKATGKATTRRRTTKPGILTDFAAKLQQAIHESGMTRYQISKASGVSEGQISKLMLHRRAPRLDTAERILKAIGRRIEII